MARRSYSNTAVATTLAADINATASSFTVTGNVTGYPSSNGVLTLDRGQPSEERVLYATRSGSSFTGVTRGYDGTAATSHSSGSAVEHTITAADLDEPNNLVNLADAKGDLIVASAADTWSRLPVGANNLFLIADAAQATGMKWAAQEVAAPNSPLGTLGYAQSTTVQNGITSEVDLTGLAVTITAGTSRRVRITGHCHWQGTPADTGAFVQIYEGATVLNRGAAYCPRNVSGTSVTAFAVLTPSAGSHTYKLRMSGAGGTVDSVPGATFPNFILVEDIGSA